VHSAATLFILSELDIQVGARPKQAIAAVPHGVTCKTGLLCKLRFWEQDEPIFWGHQLCLRRHACSCVHRHDAARTDKRIALGAAKPVGFNPRFSPDGNHSVQQSCHLCQGQGAKGEGFCPALGNNPRLVSGVHPIHTVMKGMRPLPSNQQMANVWWNNRPCKQDLPDDSGSRQ
jgi:hypothetical protein